MVALKVGKIKDWLVKHYSLGRAEKVAEKSIEEEVGNAEASAEREKREEEEKKKKQQKKDVRFPITLPL